MVLLGMAIAGCAAVGPDYIRPHTPVYKAWNTRLGGSPNTVEMDTQTLTAWWTTLGDPKLSGLIERAVKGNLDFKKAKARVREARARRCKAQADLLPALDASGSAVWTRTISGAQGYTIVESTSTGTTTGSGTSRLYTADFDAAWEMDIFGGTRRSVEAAQGDLQASEEDRRNVLVSLLAEVAVNYVDVRTYQVRLTVAEENLESQKETYQLTQWRYQAGLGDELAVQQARYNVENTNSEIPPLRTGLEEAMNGLAVLLGEQPGMVHSELEKREPVPVSPLKIAVGVPADLLRRRPDIRQAERQLAAQTARVGVATADLYPKFTLNGSIGLESFSLSNPSSGVLTLTGGPSVSWAIFKGGAIRQEIEIQSALQEQALIKYEAVVLDALKEVENAIVAYVEVQQRAKALSEATMAAKNAAELALHKYESGLTDFTNVLDAQRSLLSFQQQLAISNGDVISNLVRLYKALGGGWASPAKDADPQDSEAGRLMNMGCF